MGACYSKKATKAALKKYRMDRPTKGQRSGKQRGGGTPYSRTNTTAATTTNHTSHTRSEDNASSLDGHHTGNRTETSSHSTPQQQQRGRAMKIALREETARKSSGLNTPVSRTRSGSRGSSGASPGSSHVRVPLKTSTIAPAPPRPAPRPSSLNRFGFRSGGGRVKSGDSTDSVNSILSDAQAAYDSTSNLCDVCDEENGNVHTSSSSSSSSDSMCAGNTPKQQHQQQLQVSRLESPSSRVIRTPNLNAKVNTAPSGRLTTSTRQLPKPQVVTVKSFSPKPQSNARSQSLRVASSPRVGSSGTSPKTNTSPRAANNSLNSPRLISTSALNSPRVVASSLNNTKTLGSSLTSSPRLTNSPAVHSGKTSGKSSPPFTTQTVANHTPVRAQDQELVNQTSLGHTPRISRDSESSSKSTTEADSGLGSSSESDRIRGEGETDTLDSANLEFTEDMSDAWLKERQSAQETAKHSPRTLEVEFKGSGSFELKRKSLEAKAGGSPASVTSSLPTTASLESPLEKKAKGKEKRDGTITYGMARQKFAPYSRNRFGYGYHQANRSISASDNSTTSRYNASSAASKSSMNTTAGKSPPGTTNMSKSSTSTTSVHGLVKSRVAQLETPQIKKSPPQPPSLKRANLKKPLIRPTSLEKSPALVMPMTERTVEISKPVFRKLEYSEGELQDGKGKLHDLNTDSQLNDSPKVAKIVEDILIVGCIETETLLQAPLEMKDVVEIKMPNEKSYIEKASPDDLQRSYTKASQDAKEREKVAMETSTEASVSSEAASTPKSSPQDILRGLEDAPNKLIHSPDELKLLTPQSESSFEILESLSETLDLTLEEPIKEDSEEPPSSLSESTSSVQSEAPRKSTSPCTHSTPLAHSPQTEHPKAVDGVANTPKIATSPTDRRRPLGQLISTMKVSAGSSMDSSVESQKGSAGVGETPDGLSGMCTPVMTSGRDLDQDFLIDDEIADQPALVFGGEGASGLSSSFFGDDGMFDELVQAVTGSPPHHPAVEEIIGRARTDSIDTNTSSLGCDDLMLDYDAEESKLAGEATNTTTTTQASRASHQLPAVKPKPIHLRVCLPGPRYDEEVMSPDASEIFSEWTAMMAEMSSAERCVSRDSSCGGGRSPRGRHGSLSELTSDPRRPTVLRPPRQGSVSESEGSAGVCGGGTGGGSSSSSGGVFLDRTTYHYMYQDVTALKTMLLRLRRILHAADTMNPFDANLRNSLYLSLASSESPGLNGDKEALTPSSTQVSQENVDLRRQVVLLQQQLEDKERTIRLLQQQLAQTLTTSTTTTTQQQQQQQHQQQQQPSQPSQQQASCVEETKESFVNAATQTERLIRPPLTGSSLSRAASIDDGLGPTVSSECEGNHSGRARAASTPTPHPPRAASQPPPHPTPR